MVKIWMITWQKVYLKRVYSPKARRISQENIRFSWTFAFFYKTFICQKQIVLFKRLTQLFLLFCTFQNFEFLFFRRFSWMWYKYSQLLYWCLYKNGMWNLMVRGDCFFGRSNSWLNFLIFMQIFVYSVLIIISRMNLV